MRRRDLLSAIGILLSCSALGSPRTMRVAHIHPGEPYPSLLNAFFEELARAGYREGAELEVARYYAAGSAERLRGMVSDAIASKPDVIFASSGRTLLALKAATSIPVVGLTSDPVAYGLVASLSRPGGNVTGTIVDAGPEIWGKRLSLLMEIAPSISKVFYVAPSSAWNSALGQTIRGEAEKLRLTLVGPPVASPYDDRAVTEAFTAAIGSGAEAVLIGSSPENLTVRTTLVKLASGYRVPAIYPYEVFAKSGGLAAYDIDLVELYRRCAQQIVRILAGTSPGEIPFEQPTKVRLILNLKAASDIGLRLPGSVLARAEVVIE